MRARSARVRARSSSIAFWIGEESTSPPAKACIQRAVSSAVAAIEPAPPAAVTTDRNGITSLAGATGFATTPAGPSISR